ncbi:MAG: hypothetical protein EXQ81_10030, partial [Thermoleophilia bacterium]|nr:hypothetical protein [Thermoleophilia bacterium]
MSAQGTSSEAERGGIGAIRSRLKVWEVRPWTLLLVVAWVASTAFVAWHLNQGWVPHDDGAFAQSAQRVLDGQLPHRDFTELYTGGLTFLNAAVFALFGQNLIWLRIPMFLLFAAYVPCVYALARRFAPPLVSLLAALFAVAWGPATYPAAVPSWYLLFFSVFGALALLRYLETHHARWLVVAGVFGGLSISFKIVGVWYVIAALLFLVFIEQDAHHKGVGGRVRLGAYGLFVIAFACLSLAPVFSVLHSHLGGAEIVNFLVPIVAVCGFVIMNEARVEETSSRARLSELLRLVVPFLIGVAVPIVAILIPYIFTRSVGEILFGVLASPRSRLEDTYTGILDPVALLIAAPVAVALVGRCFVKPTVRRVIDVTGVVVLVMVFATANSLFSYTLLWTSARGLAPLVVVAGTAALAFGSDRFAPPRARNGVFLLLALASFGSLVQFPFGAPIYFCYVAPLFALAAIAASRYARAAGGLLPIALLVTYTLFGFIWLDRGAIYWFGVAPYTNPQTVILDHRRASIRVTPEDRAMYRDVAALLRRHTPGQFTYAGPDAPE